MTVQPSPPTAPTSAGGPLTGPPADPPAGPLADPENAKLVVLARAALGRAYAPHHGPAQGAAVRDTDGRTYAAATVENADPALSTSALRGAVAAAASSGARRFEAAVVTGDGSTVDGAAHDLAVLGEFGAGVAVLVVGADGALVAELTT